MVSKAEKRRYEIANVAIRLFVERGYGSVTAEDIAAAVGIGTRTFFRYFATKEDAAFPDHEGRVERFREVLRKRRGSGDPFEAVIEASLGSVREYFSDPGLYRGRYLLVRSEPALRAHERISNRAYETAIVEFLDAEFEDKATMLFGRILAAGVVGGVDAILDEWAFNPDLDTEAGLGSLREALHRIATAAPGAAGPVNGDVVLVVPDDPRLQRELIQVVQKHRNAIASAKQ